MSVLRMIPNTMLALLLLIFGRIVTLLFLRIHVEGEENVPEHGPLIVTANHFSWFDAPLLTLYLRERPAFLVASESQRFWFVRLYMRAFNGIPIWRGQVDRQAFQRALYRLREGKADAARRAGDQRRFAVEAFHAMRRPCLSKRWILSASGVR